MPIPIADYLWMRFVEEMSDTEIAELWARVGG